MEKKFEKYAALEKNENWEKLIHRQDDLYSRSDDIRSPFARDYTRVLHSLAYRRLKHKTQVFFNAAGNDHICTRIEHVQHVDSVSNTIAKELGLNEELTKAIALSHDLGHAPFGHQGEKVIKELTKTHLNKDFWHEENGVYFVDNVELLEDNQKNLQNLNLTYAVRDGIISHCGEVDQNGITPRKELIDLCENSSPENGLLLSDTMSQQLDDIKKFNYENIYSNKRLIPFMKYSEMILNQIFDELMEYYIQHKEDTIFYLSSIDFDNRYFVKGFAEWLVQYCESDFTKMEWAENISKRCKNKKIYGTLSNEKQYAQAAIDFIAGMTDVYAIKAFEELLKC